METILEDNERLDKAANDFFYLITRMSTYYVWHRDVFPQLNKVDEYHRRLVHDAVVNSHLMNCRRLNEFFYRPPKQAKYPDDLRAYKFGFEKLGPFLSKTDVEKIDKVIAHATFKAADEGKIPFEIFRYSSLAIQRSLEFADYLQISFFADNFERAGQTAQIIRSVRKDWSEWVEATPVSERRLFEN
jgi:hypothetical protein